MSRWLVAVVLALLTTTTSATAALATPANDELWRLYLRPQVLWPLLPSDAAADLMVLPPPPVRHEARYQLGRRLFHDPQLSQTGEVSCASCHQAEHAFADPGRVSTGVRGLQGKRNAPALVNTRLWQQFFWDGRSPDIHHQVAMPLTDPVEMANSTAAVEDYVAGSAEYHRLWQQAYGERLVSWSLIADAIVEFEQQLQSPAGRLDQFLRAIDQQQWLLAQQSLTDQELQGLHLFRGKAGCIKCHNGPLLSDQQFHGTGLHYYGRSFEDLGRFNVTQDPHHMGQFRTPSLRQLNATAPYMHNGLFTQMLGIIRMYGNGGARPRRPAKLPSPVYYPHTSDLLVPFKLSDDEEQALLAFLQML